MTDKKTTQTFTMFPDFIKSDKRVTNLAKMIYSDIYTIAAQGKEFFASNAWLAERYVTTESTASRAVRNLVECGYINVKIRQYIKNDKSEIGVIADEAPEQLLTEDGKGITMYDMIAVLYKAVQELNKKVETNNG